MADFREAFKRATDTNPQSELASKVGSSLHRADRQVQHREKLEKHKKDVREIGYEWFLLRVDNFSGRAEEKHIDIEGLRDRSRTLPLQMDSFSYNDNVEILKSLASGMKINEEPLHTKYQGFIGAQSILDYLEGKDGDQKTIISGEYVRLRAFTQILGDLNISSHWPEVAMFLYDPDTFKNDKTLTLNKLITTVAQFIKPAPRQR